jgi:outer membrane protein assembly factor BamA
MLKPADGAIPVLYQNFPWWKSDALTAAVAAKVPLFHGAVVPESGLQSQIATALAALVQTKGVTATIDAVPYRDESGNLKGVQFRIAAPAVQIGDLQFQGASPAWVEQLAPVQKAASGQDYGAGTESQIAVAVRTIYHRQGYLDASVADFIYRDPQFTDGKVLVPLDVNIVEGAQYRLAQFTLSGDVLMAPEEFAKRVRIHAGDIVDEDLVRQTIAAIAQPYKAQGYLRATINATPSLDRAQHTVSYSVTVVPGPVFHMGKLTILNLDPTKQALILKYWTLHEGDVYDTTYPPSFLHRNKDTLHELDAWSASYKQYEHEDTHIVDLVITFKQGGPLS